MRHSRLVSRLRPAIQGERSRVRRPYRLRFAFSSVSSRTQFPEAGPVSTWNRKTYAAIRTPGTQSDCSHRRRVPGPSTTLRFLGVHRLEGHLFDNLASSAGECTGGWRPPINVAERAAAEQAVARCRMATASRRCRRAAAARSAGAGRHRGSRVVEVDDEPDPSRGDPDADPDPVVRRVHHVDPVTAGWAPGSLRLEVEMRAKHRRHGAGGRSAAKVLRPAIARVARAPEPIARGAAVEVAADARGREELRVRAGHPVADPAIEHERGETAPAGARARA